MIDAERGEGPLEPFGGAPTQRGIVPSAVARHDRAGIHERSLGVLGATPLLTLETAYPWSGASAIAYPPPMQ
jgi:hypothetical protein